MTNRKNEAGAEALGDGARRRRRTVAEKVVTVRESRKPQASVWLVAGRHGVNPNQVFHWRELYRERSPASQGHKGEHAIHFRLGRPRWLTLESTIPYEDLTCKPPFTYFARKPPSHRKQQSFNKTRHWFAADLLEVS